MNSPPLKTILRILFHFDPTARLNLFTTFPLLKRFFLHRSNLLIVRSAGDVLFILIILSGFFGPQEPGRNITLFVAWGIWWTSIVLSWFLVGKLWCGVCPFPGIGRVLQNMGIVVNRPVPHWMRKHGPTLSLALLALILWAEAAADMRLRPAATAALLLAIVGGATLFGALYQGQSWCRYLCPMGKIIGSAATISMIELRPDPMRCRKCVTFACKKGTDRAHGCPIHLGAFNVRDSVDCLMCGHCISTCDQDSPHLNLRNPFAELVLNRGRYLAYAYIIPFLMGNQLARLTQEKPWYRDSLAYFGNSNVLAISVLMAAGYGFIWLLLRMGAYLLRPDPRTSRISPMVSVFIPLAFTGELVYRLEYFLNQIGQTLPIIGRQFGVPLETYGFVIPQQFIEITGIILLLIGGASSMKALNLINAADRRLSLPFRSLALLGSLICIVLFVYIICYQKM
jgi:polyferredoxin